MADRFDHIEDAEALPFDMSHEPLSDDQLAHGGLVEVRAWVRSKASANALRQQRKREKQAEEGRAQVNVVVPEECKEPLKELAAALAAGQIDADQVRAMIAGADVVAEAATLRDDLDREKALRAELETNAGNLAARLDSANAELARLKTEASRYQDRLNGLADELAKIKTARDEDSIRHAKEAAKARDQVDVLTASVEHSEAMLLEQAQVMGAQIEEVEALADAARAALTAAAAERDSLRAALDAHTLRSRLARWLVGRV